MSLTQHWKCQDNAASTVVVATVGTNGVLVGGDDTSVLSVVDGPGTAFPRSLDLDGTSDYLDISAAAPSFASGTAYSFSAWVKFDSLTNRPVFGVDSSNQPRIILLNSTTVRTTMNATSTNRDYAVPTVSTGTWYHLLVTRTAGNSQRVFWSGIESATGAITGAELVAPTRVGRVNTLRLGGSICDVRVYDSDESANVAAIMAEKDAGGATTILPHMMHYLAG